ncbi:hypothetical protein JNA64_09230 [Pseudomonas stutzeri]|uniref:hypothetical protein n=1 Tax=Stutzerimonas stutzeri TaxID=316 RepID=UPI001F51DF16|nr:hypothetical protein [Stutzerimonas stutzeri]MCI0917346.1 hypothetical protein [Stutzerimonas stutzeri]
MKLVADLIQDAAFHLDSGVLEIGLPLEKLEALFGELVRIGYKEEKIIEPGHNGSCLSVALNADAWNCDSPFYPSIRELWDYVKRNSKFPQCFYLLEEKSHSDEDEKSFCIRALEYYLAWRGFLFGLKDHVGSENDGAALIYFIGTEKGAKKYIINPIKISLDDLLGISEDNSGHEDLKLLVEELTKKDGHKKEREKVLRASLSEVIEEGHKETTMTFLMKQGGRLRKKYQENYDLYLDNFSVNKHLVEIEEKSTDYITKINESISTSQSKAFAIPGAIIAIAALVKNTDALALFLVCFGLLCVWLLTVVANNIHDEAYVALSEQVRRSLKRYEIIKDADSVRVSAEHAKNKLIGLIDRARRRLIFINRLALTVFIVGLLYSFVVNDFTRGYIFSFFKASYGYMEPFGRIERLSWAAEERLPAKGSVEIVSKTVANKAHH